MAESFGEIFKFAILGFYLSVTSFRSVFSFFITGLKFGGLFIGGGFQVFFYSAD